MTGGSAEVALIHRQYGPYHMARAHALEGRLPGRVHFIQLASHEALRPWEIRCPAPTLRTVADGTLEEMPEATVATRLVSLLEAVRPGAVVIAGYDHAAMRAAARWCRQKGSASILLSDSHRVDRRRIRAKEWVKRKWVSHYFDAAFTAGAVSAAYARDLGFRSSRIWRGYDVVDNAFFDRAAAGAKARGQALLRELGLPEKVFLYVGRLSPEKNIVRLVEAVSAYRERAGARAWGLLLVGSGPQGPWLEDLTRSRRGTIAFTGFRQIDRLPDVYAAAAALILPSLSEPWGLVINEAMASGLPILASDRVGAVPDLVFPGINGYVFDPMSQEEMVDTMLRLSSEQVDREAMGRSSRKIIANFTCETWATALTDCIEVTLARKSRV